VTCQNLVDQYSTSVCSVEGAVGIPNSFIRDFGKSTATLMLQLFKRKSDLEPQYNRNVDHWLRLLFTPRWYEKGLGWIAWSLAFEEGPICALSIAGPPGIGKKMLVQGLAECIDSEVFADAKEMLGNFQSQLFRTPFLVVNEGFPRTRKDADPADEFRKLVSGDPIHFTQKFRDSMIVRNPVRMVLTANNEDIIGEITGGRDLSPEDKEAVVQRLFHVQSGHDAQKWLNEMGGMNYTEGWIRGDSGSASQYTVARHFLALYEDRRKYPTGSRLLVEGEMGDSIMNLMKTRSGSSPDVVECLIQMIENAGAVGNKNIIIKDGRVFVTSSQIVDYFRNTIGKTSKRDLTHNKVMKVLRSLRVPNDKEYPYALEISKGVLKSARWREIDVSILLQEAVEHGYPNAKLSQLYQQQSKKQLEAIIT
jgi:hypothetical protein